MGGWLTLPARGGTVARRGVGVSQRYPRRGATFSGGHDVPCAGGVTLPAGGTDIPLRATPTHQGGTICDQHVVWESWLQTLQTWSRSLPYVSLWLSTNQNLEPRNFLSVRPPYMEKNKLLLNEYLGDFMHFETLFFSENDLFQTHPPTKVRKNLIFFLKPSLAYFKDSQINDKDFL